MSPEPEARTLSWPRAVLSAGAVLVVSFALVVVVPNTILTRFAGLAPGARQAAATTWFFAALLAEAWVLRRLQARQIL